MPYFNLSIAEEKLFKELLEQSEFSIGDIVTITKSGGNDSQFPGYSFFESDSESSHRIVLTKSVPLTGYIDEIYLNAAGELSFKIKRFDSEDEYYVVRERFLNSVDTFTYMVETIKKELDE